MRLLTAKSSISNADKLVIEIPTHIEGKKGDKIVKDFFQSSLCFFFPKSSNPTLLKFSKIEQIKEIKVVLESLSLNRMCFGKLEHLTLGLDQIYCSANSVTSCRRAYCSFCILRL